MPTLPMSCSGADLNRVTMVAIGERRGEARMAAQLLGQRLDVVLGAADVVAGIGVAGFGQRGHGLDGHILDRHHLARAAGHFLFEESRLVAQEVGGGLEAQVGLDARQHDRRADRLGDVVHRAHFKPCLSSSSWLRAVRKMTGMSRVRSARP